MVLTLQKAPSKLLYILTVVTQKTYLQEEADAATELNDVSPRSRVNPRNPANHNKIAFTSRIDGMGMTGSHSQNHRFPVD
jgi:hypothetical protein